MKLTRRQQALTKQFNLPANAELWYGSRKVGGQSLRGWYVLENGNLRYLGKGAETIREHVSSIQSTQIIPR
jgi:hypothetical protein